MRKLFIKCLNEVKDHEGLYFSAGKEYEVINIINGWLVESEENNELIDIDYDDVDFELVIKK